MSENSDEEFSNQTSISEFINSVPGLGRVTKVNLQNAGYETVGDLRKTELSELCEIDYIGPTTAEKLLDSVTKEDDEVATPSTSDCTRKNNTPLERWAEPIPKVGRVKIVRLKRAGYETVGDIHEADKDELTTVETIGPTIAERILDSVNQESARENSSKTHEAESETNTDDDKNESLDTVETILRDLEIDDGL